MRISYYLVILLAAQALVHGAASEVANAAASGDKARCER